jgi:LPXTG-site transpeptidase (sortase) family protein
VAEGAANYASETAPNNTTKGQTFIFGHNNRSVFGPLLNLKTGDEVYVYTTNGHVFKYSYDGAQDVSPRQVKLISDMAKAPAGLVMMTCDGPYFQYRHLMSFKIIQAA